MVQVVPYTPEWSSAVRAFNERLVRGGLDPDLKFPEEPKEQFSTDPEQPIWQEFFLAAEGDIVRGGYFLTHEPWVINREKISIANYRLPLSEGLIDPAHRGIALTLIRHSLKRQPLIYCLGMGSEKHPFPRALQAMKWPMFATPFFFRSVRPSRVFRNLISVRSSPLKALLLDAAAFSGAASIIVKSMQAMRTKPAPNLRTMQEEDFDGWADEVWGTARNQYRMIADRCSAILRIRYLKTDKRFVRLHLPGAGWAILLSTQMSSHRHFGNLRVGTIVDCLAKEGQAHAVVKAATRLLEQLGTDLIISNQADRSWCSAFRDCGYLEGPSNRIFAASPKLAAMLQPFEESRTMLHLTRGDAAGPIHL